MASRPKIIKNRLVQQGTRAGDAQVQRAKRMGSRAGRQAREQHGQAVEAAEPRRTTRGRFAQVVEQILGNNRNRKRKGGSGGHEKSRMRGFFSPQRETAPLVPPQAAAAAAANKEETIQALRRRQKEKQRNYVAQMFRAQKEVEMAQEEGDNEKARAAEMKRRMMNDAANALSAQVASLERIMEEVGMTEELEEDGRETEDMLEQSREQYENGLQDAEEQIQEVAAQGEYISTMASPFMMPSDVFDEDEAMRDLDEHVKQSGRA